MSERFHVRVTKDYLVFSAAHFITFAGNVCERLHGHNYRIACEAHGPLDENQYVVDFVALRDMLRELSLELDHHMLFPTAHPTIRVNAGEREVEVNFEDRRWVFPKRDCVLLPVANTTAELLAKYLAGRLLTAFDDRRMARPDRLRIEVDECEGQIGVYEWTA